MARTARIKETSNGVAYYHLMSRTNDRRYLFESPKVKDALVDALRRTAAFSGMEIECYTVMDNHFHVVCKVERSDDPILEDTLLERVGILKGEESRNRLETYWHTLRTAGWEDALKASQDNLRRRMNDISEFMKTFKETFDRLYKREHDYCGSIWSGRFNSVLIEGGEYLARCKKYVMYNPIRAGIVTQVKNYNWSWCKEESSEELRCFCSEAIISPGSVPGGSVFNWGASNRGDSEGDPEGGEWWKVRVAQMEKGKVMGGFDFVTAKAGQFGEKFHGVRVVAHPVVAANAGEKGTLDNAALGFSTHGWMKR